MLTDAAALKLLPEELEQDPQALAGTLLRWRNPWGLRFGRDRDFSWELGKNQELRAIVERPVVLQEADPALAFPGKGRRFCRPILGDDAQNRPLLL